MGARLARSATDKMIAGVCGGIAEYLAVDATIVRLAFVVAGFVGGAGLLLYVVLALVMPQPGASGETPEERALRPVAGPGGGAQEAAAQVERRREFAGYALMVVGALFLLANLGAFRFVEWRVIWPIAVIAAGVLLIVQHRRRP